MGKKELTNNEYLNQFLKILSYSIVLFYLVIFIYIACTTSPATINELDSLGQHIPLAKSIIDGKIFNPPSLHNGLGYYMPNSEILLSLFMKLNIPLGLFNIIPFLLIFIIGLKIGKLYGINRNLSILYSLSITTFNTVLRLVPTQKNDLWVDVLFLLSIVIFKVNFKHIVFKYLLCGISLGLLIGTKYTGLIYAISLIVIYTKTVLKNINLKHLLFMVFPILIFGLIWYIRNYIITDNPFYPVSIFGFNGDPNFIVPRGYQTIFNKNMFQINVDSLMSEYLFWILSPLAIVFAMLKKYKYSKELLLLFLTGIVVYLLAPSEYYRVNIVSNLRFSHPALFISTLSMFLVFQKQKQVIMPAIITILTSLSVVSQYPYMPKLIIFCTLIIFFFNKILRININRI